MLMCYAAVLACAVYLILSQPVFLQGLASAVFPTVQLMSPIKHRVHHCASPSWCLFPQYRFSFRNLKQIYNSSAQQPEQTATGMSLLDLSNELLTSILSFKDALDYIDLFNIFITCQRLNLDTLPFLYRSIRKLALHLREPSRNTFEEIVGHFNRFPERLLWVKKVRASWYWQNNR